MKIYYTKEEIFEIVKGNALKSLNNVRKEDLEAEEILDPEDYTLTGIELTIKPKVAHNVK